MLHKYCASLERESVATRWHRAAADSRRVSCFVSRASLSHTLHRAVSHLERALHIKKANLEAGHAVSAGKRIGCAGHMGQSVATCQGHLASVFRLQKAFRRSAALFEEACTTLRQRSRKCLSPNAFFRRPCELCQAVPAAQLQCARGALCAADSESAGWRTRGA